MSHALLSMPIKIEYEYKKIVDFIGWRVSGILKPSRQNWISTFDVESKKFDKVSCCDDKEPLLGSSNGIV